MSRQTTDRTREKINTIMVPHLKPYYCYCYKSTHVHKGMQVKPQVGSIITYVHSHLSYLFTFNFHTIYVLPRLSIHSYPDYRHTQQKAQNEPLNCNYSSIRTANIYCLCWSCTCFFYFPLQQLYNPNLIIIVTNFLLLQSCTKPFGSGYCHDDQTGDMLRCSTVCIHFSCPPLTQYLTLPYLLYSTLLYLLYRWSVCVSGFCTFFSVFFSSPLLFWKRFRMEY